MNIKSVTRRTPGWYQRPFAWLMAHATAKYEAEMSEVASANYFPTCTVMF